MREFLVFGLSGTMTAFGEITVGERRSIWNTPSKSAVLGLIAGGLGIVRKEARALQELEAGLGFGVRNDASGLPMRDYHTAQAPRARKSGRWRTRREEVADEDELNTVLSERFYRLEASATVALWRKADGAPPLAPLVEGLRRPCFAPYLGRKACPLDRAPRPLIVEADCLLAAFDAYDSHEREAGLILRAWFKSQAVDRTSPVWFEMDAGLAPEEALALSEGEIRQRRDSLRDRGLWQFSDRREGRLVWRAPIFGQEGAA